jgi:fatty acid desaturase
MDNEQKYRFACTLTFGDIYGQIIVWLVILIISLAASLALMGARQPIFALATVGLILVLSLPFLLFAFVTTLINHIEFQPVEASKTQSAAKSSSRAPQAPAQATS